jgi:hypothetical protein
MATDPRRMCPNIEKQRHKQRVNFQSIAMLMRNRNIPSFLLEERHRHFAEVVYLMEPVSAYEHAAETHGSLHYSWDNNMVAYYQDKLLDDSILLSAWQEVPAGVFAGLLDTTRTRVLTLALDIQAEIGESDADLKALGSDSQEAAKVNRIINNAFYGAVYISSNQSPMNVHNIAVGSWDGLTGAMQSLGIGDPEMTELSDAVKEDGKTIGSRVKQWALTYGGKVVSAGAQSSIAAGQAMLLDLLERHFGLKK